jgi:phage shock protein C
MLGFVNLARLVLIRARTTSRYRSNEMQTTRPNLLTRDDTFFGICEGLGEDLGINANLLRLALAGWLFFDPLAAVGAYAAAGFLVLVTRLLIPNPRPAQEEPEVVEAEQPAEHLEETLSLAA